MLGSDVKDRRQRKQVAGTVASMNETGYIVQLGALALEVLRYSSDSDTYGGGFELGRADVPSVDTLLGCMYEVPLFLVAARRQPSADSLWSLGKYYLGWYCV